MAGKRLDRPTPVPAVVERGGLSRARGRGGGRAYRLVAGSVRSSIPVVCCPPVRSTKDRPRLKDGLHLLGVATEVRMALACQSAERPADGVALGLRSHPQHRVKIGHGVAITRRFLQCPWPTPARASLRTSVGQNSHQCAPMPRGIRTPLGVTRHDPRIVPGRCRGSVRKSLPPLRRGRPHLGGADPRSRSRRCCAG